MPVVFEPPGITPAKHRPRTSRPASYHSYLLRLRRLLPRVFIASVSMGGIFLSPASHRATVTRCTPTAFASPACVSPSLSRATFNSRPLIAVTIGNTPPLSSQGQKWAQNGHRIAESLINSCANRTHRTSNPVRHRISRALCCSMNFSKSRVSTRCRRSQRTMGRCPAQIRRRTVTSEQFR